MAGCSRGSNSSGTPDTTVGTDSTAETTTEAATSTSTEPTTTEPVPTPIAKGTLKVTPARSRPPTEPLPTFRAVKVASANHPAGLAAAPDGRIFFSELWGGQIRVIRRDGTVAPRPWADVNARFGIRWAQFYHGVSRESLSIRTSGATTSSTWSQCPGQEDRLRHQSLVVRYKEVKGRDDRRTSSSPFRREVRQHGSLVFGPDGMLYVPTGFLGEGRRARADPLADLRGKILRVTPTGKAPGDNPYGKRAPRVWALGFKNTFDLAFLPGDEVAAIGGDNGTVGHDEINLLMPGHHYGYPEREGITSSRRLTPPMFDYQGNATAPVGIVYYRGRRFPALRGRFLMRENHGDGMLALRIDQSDPGKLKRMTPIVGECTVDIVATRGGSIFFSDAGAVYRLAQA